MLDVKDFEWLVIDKNDYSDTVFNQKTTERAKVPGGWLILITTEWYRSHITSDKYKATENVIFVPDPNYTWGV